MGEIKLKITTVELEELIDILTELVEEYHALAVLIPFWNIQEAQKHIDRIGELLSKIITAKKDN